MQTNHPQRPSHVRHHHGQPPVHPTGPPPPPPPAATVGMNIPPRGIVPQVNVPPQIGVPHHHQQQQQQQQEQQIYRHLQSMQQPPIPTTRAPHDPGQQQQQQQQHLVRYNQPGQRRLDFRHQQIQYQSKNRGGAPLPIYQQPSTSNHQGAAQQQQQGRLKQGQQPPLPSKQRSNSQQAWPVSQQSTQQSHQVQQQQSLSRSLPFNTPQAPRSQRSQIPKYQSVSARKHQQHRSKSPLTTDSQLSQQQSGSVPQQYQILTRSKTQTLQKLQSQNLENLPPPSPNISDQQQSTESSNNITSTTTSVHVSMTTQQQTISTQQTRKVQTTIAANELSTQQNLITTTETTTERNTENICDIVNHQTTKNDTLANTKEKTPMCLVNELARYNKIQHQYRLTGEEGPAHSRCFTVTLLLGTEDYTATGASIKKAQHTAAAEAIRETKYYQPPIKLNRSKTGKNGVGNLTPTVELNALAMKLGKPTVYVITPIQDMTQTAAPTKQLSNPVGLCAGIPVPPMPKIPLIPNRTFQTNNFSLQVQKLNYFPDRNIQNNNANIVFEHPAVSYMRKKQRFAPRFISKGDGTKTIVTRDQCEITLIVGDQEFYGYGKTIQAAKHSAATKALAALKPLIKTDEEANVIDASNGDEDTSDLKSPISLVHEAGLRRNLPVTFEVRSEKGPPHMKTFITLCTVGNITTEGEGNGKRLSKKQAAEKMLEELKKLPALSPKKLTPPVKPPKKKALQIKKKPKTLVKEKIEPDKNTDDINPVSKLMQIQQSIKAREPFYTVVEEKGAPRRREFVIEVDAGGQKARGMGSNKKMAKRNAAANLLAIMDQETTPSVVPDKNVIEQDEITPSVNVGGSSGRQLVPGIIIMKKPKVAKTTTKSSVPSLSEKKKATKLLNDTASKDNGSFQGGVRPREQLNYLAKLLGFQVQYSDYPRANHTEYLTVITLTTDPLQMCHGGGSSPEISRDKAALEALKTLRKLGCDNIKPKIRPISESSDE